MRNCANSVDDIIMKSLRDVNKKTNINPNTFIYLRRLVSSIGAELYTNIFKSVPSLDLKSIQEYIHSLGLGQVYEKYDIIDNADIPFTVYVECHHKNLLLYSHSTKNAREVKTQEVFIGEAVVDEDTLFSCGWGDQYLGNTILAYLGDSRYLFIGGAVYIFKSYHPIEYFVSPIGNSSVPYPYARDSNGGYYFFDLTTASYISELDSDIYPNDIRYTDKVIPVDVTIVIDRDILNKMTYINYMCDLK